MLGLLDELAGKRVVIMGLGLFGGGAGAARFFAHRNAAVTVTDLRDADVLAESVRSLSDFDITFHLGGHDESDFRSADILVVNPAVKPGDGFVRVARQSGAAVTTEVNLCMQLANGPVVGITGTKGKSTTTALLGEMLRKHDERTIVGGNIGGSVLDDVASSSPGTPVVMELSSFQLYRLPLCARSPHVAVVLNLSPDHLDWHGSAEAYYAAKHNILEFQTETDHAVLSADDATVASWGDPARRRTAFFATEAETAIGSPVYARLHRTSPDRLSDVLVVEGPWGKFELDARQLRLPGEHNVSNALAAALAAKIMGAADGEVAEVLRSFAGLPHRLEEVAVVNGVRYVNDSMATTPEATIAALSSFRGPIALIAGGYDKGLDLGRLSEEICRKTSLLVLIGQTGPKLRELVAVARRTVNSSPSVVSCRTLEEALSAAAAIGSGGTVLLSPACASYDMFVNFRARGEAFRRAVRGLAAAASGPGEVAGTKQGATDG